MLLYLKIVGIAMIPVLLSVIFVLLRERTRFGKLSKTAQNIIIGIVFGGAAIFGTEFGVDIGGAQVNARDAAPLCAGLIFSAPAGIIAGCIGGVERWLAVYWGVGAYTRIACSVSTVLAGLFAAYLRKFMFDDHRPNPAISLFTAIVMEFLHMLMVFVTHIDDAYHAYEIIRVCLGPMVFANSLSVLLAILIVQIIKHSFRQRRTGTREISRQVQTRLLAAILIALVCSYLFTSRLESGISQNQTNSLLQTNLQDVQKEISDTSDENILRIARIASSEMGMDMKSKPLEAKARRFDFSEINVVDKNGVIIASTNPDYIGFDMASGSQSAEFLCLLNGEKEYVQSYQPTTYNRSVYYKYAGIALRGGFLQFGYDEARFHADIADQVSNVTVNRHIGKTGFLTIIDGSGKVVSEPSGESVGTIIDDAEMTLEALNDIPENTRFETMIDGAPYYCMYSMREGYYIIAALSVEEANSLFDLNFYVNSIIMVLIFGVLFGLIYFIIKKLVVQNVQQVNSSLSLITAGNLDERVNVGGTAEFESLSSGINSTVDSLKRYIEEAKARIDEELKLARMIQKSVLPVEPSNNPSVDLFASMNPAREVGGDFYDYYWLDSDHLVVLIADVSGKGIPAAMFMMSAKTMLKSFAREEKNLDNVFTRANSGLCEGNDSNMFVTAWMGILDVRTGVLEYVNGGHNPPLVRHADGSFEYLKTPAGFVLAGLPIVRYKHREMTLEPGSVLFIYTDGVTEATDLNSELYGEERLQNCLNTHTNEDMQSLCVSVKADVDAFVGEAPQFDDITMLALKYDPLAGGTHEGN